jgi:hypothetical protein
MKIKSTIYETYLHGKEMNIILKNRKEVNREEMKRNGKYSIGTSCIVCIFLNKN